MEIESKYLIQTVPENLDYYQKKEIEQGYVSTNPVIRIRKMNNDYYLTVKGTGLSMREEFEMLIDFEAYKRLLNKLEYPLLKKTRYFIPYENRTIELDIFHGHLEGLVLAEVEFNSSQEQQAFVPPSWFAANVTEEAKYQNNRLCRLTDLSSL